jgi:hypothetical protein
MTNTALQLIDQLQQELNPERRELICKAMDFLATGNVNEAERILVALQSKTLVIKELYPEAIDIKVIKLEPDMFRGIPLYPEATDIKVIKHEPDMFRGIPRIYT